MIGIRIPNNKGYSQAELARNFYRLGPAQLELDMKKTLLGNSVNKNLTRLIWTEFEFYGIPIDLTCVKFELKLYLFHSSIQFDLYKYLYNLSQLYFFELRLSSMELKSIQII